MLAEHYFKHKIDHYVILPSFQKQKIKYSSSYHDVKPHVLACSTSGQRQVMLQRVVHAQ